MKTQRRGTATITRLVLSEATATMLQVRLIFDIQKMAWVEQFKSSSQPDSDIMVNLLHSLRPVLRYVPFIAGPPRELTVPQRTVYTAAGLFLYLICCQLPLYGMDRYFSQSDPLYWTRVMLASSRGSLMDLGISPIISASWIIWVLQMVKLITIEDDQDQKLFNNFYKLLSVVSCLTQALCQLQAGHYGDTNNMSVLTVVLILLQLLASGMLIVMLDEMLEEGYGLGSGISLFLCANICESTVWAMLSPVTTYVTEVGMEFQGSLVCLVHALLTKNSKTEAIYFAFTRQGNNLTQLCGEVAIFLVVIYLTRVKAKLKLVNCDRRGAVKQETIKLFYSSTLSIIFQSLFAAKFFSIVEMLCHKFEHLKITQIFGVWENGDLVGGLLWYISPLESCSQMIDHPIRMLTYTVFVCGVCVAMAQFLIEVDTKSSKDVAVRLLEGGWRMEDPKKSVYEEVKWRVSVAVKLGGIAIGLLTIAAEMINTSGSSVGMIVVVSILTGYFEKLKTKGGRSYPE